MKNFDELSNGTLSEMMLASMACCVLLATFLSGWALAIDPTPVSRVVMVVLALALTTMLGSWWVLACREYEARKERERRGHRDAGHNDFIYPEGKRPGSEEEED